MVKPSVNYIIKKKLKEGLELANEYEIKFLSIFSLTMQVGWLDVMLHVYIY